MIPYIIPSYPMYWARSVSNAYVVYWARVCEPYLSYVVYWARVCEHRYVVYCARIYKWLYG